MKSSHATLFPVLALALVVAATAFRPGDAPWIADEPLLLYGAIEYNATPSHLWKIHLPFTPAPYGLIGTRGAHYGPLAVWLDQILLVFTHNPIVMIAIRALLFSAITAAALYWLAKTLGVTPWLAVAIMLSPWLWFYSRQLWDNSLCIPFCAMLFAAYADFILTRRPWSLRLAALCAILLLLIHLMAIALVAPIVLHLAIFEFRSLWRFKWDIAAIIAIATAISWPYWSNLLHGYHQNIPGGTSPWRGYFFPIFGAHHLTAAGLTNVLGKNWHSNAILIDVTLLAYPAVWIAMLLAIPGVWRILRRSPKASPVDHIFAVAWVVVIFQSLLDGSLHVYEGPHYFNATWIVYAAFAYLAARVLRPWMIALYAVALLIVTVAIAQTLHDNAGIRSPNFGTSLSEQIAAVRQIQQFSADSPLQIDIPQWTAHRVALTTLRELFPPPATERPRRSIIVRYRSANPVDAHLMVWASDPNGE
ncbi:MAG TPA: hypothetical protein VHX86_11965 [Tepidisphaeraceae bacterium]|jgi:4-amino-4-deoxy-L-arabinose transferase-like glycosyltransferase|nr:hypothetical protein [Tepidisphaeraceae bacterium]